MIICGIELKANSAIFSLIDTKNTNPYLSIREKKITIKDDEKIEDIEIFSNEIKNLIKKYDIEKIALKKRAKKGNFAGGAVTFKLEAIIQLNGICDVELITPQTISKYEKQNPIEFPESLNKYQEASYVTALYFASTN